MTNHRPWCNSRKNSDSTLCDCDAKGMEFRMETENKPKHTHKSGATSSGNYPKYYLIPLCFIRRTAERFTYGAERHGEYNWKKGLKDRDFILDRLSHAMVHLQKAMDNIAQNRPSTDDDLGGVACNVAMAMEYEEVKNNSTSQIGERDT